ncbi:MAG: STAS domain-containing protein [Steroidobacteraceae bacterium]
MTQTPSLKALGDGSFALSGDLVFEHVTRLLGEGDAAFGASARADIDLAQVGRVDSAGLALLLEWSIVAREAGRSVNYRNLPPALSALAGISDVSELLPAAAGSGGG